MPPYTLKLESLSITDRNEWHYCSDCWKRVSNYLSDRIDVITTDSVIYKNINVASRQDDGSFLWKY